MGKKSKMSQISRREFLKGAGLMVGGLAAASPMAYLSSCGGASNKLEILNPVGDLGVEIVAPSKRLDTLDGKRIGLYVAQRANSLEFMARLAIDLKKQFPTITILGGVPGTVWWKESYDREGNLDPLIADKPDGIIMALSS
jgi:hypothetical protein